MRSMLAILALMSAVASGCGGSPYFRPHAFVPPLRHYRVRYVDADARAVVGPEWRVLNFHDGRIPDADGWMTSRRVDEGAGPRRLRLPTFDLFVQHREDRSAMFVMTVPVSPRMAARELQVVARDHVDELLGRTLARLHSRSSRGDRVEASRVLEDGPAVVGGAEAHLMTIERARSGSRSGTGHLLTFVVIRPPRRWRSTGLADEAHGAAMLILAGLQSSARRHEAHRAELDGLLDRLDVRPGE